MEPHHIGKHQCPFCEQETLEVMTWPSHTAIKQSRSAVAKSTTYQKKPEGFELLSEKCSNCGKTDKEIQRAWKDGTRKDDEDKRKKRLEQLKKLGFSGVFKSKVN